MSISSDSDSAPEKPTMEHLTDDSRPPQFKGLKAATEFCNFSSIQELREFWETEMWKPYVDRLQEDVIKVEQEQARAAGKSGRNRSKNFQTIEALLLENVRFGRSKYFRSDPDFGHFEKDDYYCWTLHNLVRDNSEDNQGLFWRTSMGHHAKLCVIWSLIQIWLFGHCTSRTLKRVAGEIKAAEKAETKAAKEAANRVEKTPSEDEASE